MFHRRQLNLLKFAWFLLQVALAAFSCVALAYFSFTSLSSFQEENGVTVLFRRNALSFEDPSKILQTSKSASETSSSLLGGNNKKEQGESAALEETDYLKKYKLQYRIIASAVKSKMQRKAGSSLAEDGVIVWEKETKNYYFFEDSSIIDNLRQSALYEVEEDNSILHRKEAHKMKEMSATSLMQLKQFQYGRWCGPDFGGFESDCKDVCSENLEKPSDECKKCKPPINYLDEVCMEHDFCQQRYFERVKKEGKGFICAYRVLNVGQYFQTKCECTYFIQEKLKRDNLIKQCDSLDCIAYGLIVEKAFNNILFDCGCYYIEYHRNVYSGKMDPLEMQKCVSPSECQSFGGK